MTEKAKLSVFVKQFLKKKKKKMKKESTFLLNYITAFVQSP